MHIWIIELHSRVSGKWEPCAAARLTKSAAKVEAKKWKFDNPSDKFRVAKYKPADNWSKKPTIAES